MNDCHHISNKTLTQLEGKVLKFTDESQTASIMNFILHKSELQFADCAHVSSHTDHIITSTIE